MCQNALLGTLFKQLPQAQVGPTFKKVCAHQSDNDQTIVLSPENVHKVYSRPKLWVFENKLLQNGALNEECLFKQLPRAQFLRSPKISGPIRERIAKRLF